METTKKSIPVMLQLEFNFEETATLCPATESCGNGGRRNGNRTACAVLDDDDRCPRCNASLPLSACACERCGQKTCE